MACRVFLVALFVGVVAAAPFRGSAPATPSSSSFTVQANSDGSYSVLVDGTVWLESAATFVTVNGDTYSTANGSLTLANTTKHSGTDSGGDYARTEVTWLAGSSYAWTTFIKVYAQHAVFGQHFETDTAGTSVGSSAHVLSSFPSFKVVNTPRRGYASFAGDMCAGEGTKTGVWDPSTKNIGTGISGSGPIVLFSEDASTTLVLGAFSNFMVHSQDFQDGAISYGVLGSVQSIPAGFVIETLVSLSQGVHTAMLAWGDQLLARYGKDRYGYKNDYILTHLGYSTDNGAYYYYQTEAGLNYEDTLLDVKKYADQAGIPYRHVLLDSWWYFKGEGAGVSLWDARPDIFPHGLEYLYNQTGWVQQLHNRYWASNTTYAKQNGGKWDFLIEDAHSIALPTDPAFWDMLLQDKRTTGMYMYEQDWLDVQFDKTSALQQSATLARNWMMQMGEAAARTGVTMQECMSHVRHVLQSVELPAITNARASDDYHPGNAQWNIGTSSILAHAVGIAPSKDNYWSTDVQTDTHYGPTTKEPFNRMQSAVSSFSTGPVAPSDKIGRSDVALIMRACMSDGTLLQPTKPATAIDAHFINAALGQGGVDGEVWQSYTQLSNYRVSYVIAINVRQAYQLHLSELDTSATTLAVFEANTTSTIHTVDAATPLDIAACGQWDFQLFTLSPVVNGWALLGEPNKWVSVSEARFSAVTLDEEGLVATVQGVPGETVTVNVLTPSGTITTTQCAIPPTYKARLVVTAAGGSCLPQ